MSGNSLSWRDGGGKQKLQQIERRLLIFLFVKSSDYNDLHTRQTFLMGRTESV